LGLAHLRAFLGRHRNIALDRIAGQAISNVRRGASRRVLRAPIQISEPRMDLTNPSRCRHSGSDSRRASPEDSRCTPSCHGHPEGKLEKLSTNSPPLQCVILLYKRKTFMPFCTQCGNRVDQTAAYCAQCGKAQRGPTVPPSQDLLDGLSERTASILCYIPVFGVIPSIIFLASQKFRHNQRVRFDGFQSVYLFVTWLIVSSAGPFVVIGVPFHRSLSSLFETLLSLCWIFLLIKAAQSEQVHLPILGDLAARSASEQL
jgi:uncharacterized membrane protein